ncbi:glycosyltransferase [Panacibacter ginsenosidivorans]|uniref:Glycosyltransferase n=1 Tax=Panacibacter ginsenosidivorans TaxID=1813871 RepID=A0A5B8VC44_9BACT|nr:glycosyltransferase [Panacibacter ginsenosidivorans]QEC69097.1 glycosyltransferase [Panacibacter ginsenosidivorans]
MENKFKRLAIISDCVHMRNEDGMAVTENHIYCRQIQELSKHFEHTVIVCPFVAFTNESVTSVYTLPFIDFIELPNAGGNTISDKWKLIRTIPTWISAFKKAKRVSDIIFLRMPNNLSIPGFFYFKFKRAKTFAVYTGTWDNYTNEPLTYRFQKWLLKKFFEGPVWIYVNKKPADHHLLKGYSPSYSEAEWMEETEQVAKRIAEYEHTEIERPVFITVGALVPNKNQQYILETCKRLRDNGFSFYWYIVGDGYLKENYATFIEENVLQHHVCLAGKKTYTELRDLYRKANFLVQATYVEGFGKAPIEGMFHGVIPLLSKTAMAEEMTGDGNRGFIFDTSDEHSLEQVIKRAMTARDRFNDIITNGREYVKSQTIQSWSACIINNINSYFK